MQSAAVMRLLEGFGIGVGMWCMGFAVDLLPGVLRDTPGVLLFAVVGAVTNLTRARIALVILCGLCAAVIVIASETPISGVLASRWVRADSLPAKVDGNYKLPPLELLDNPPLEYAKIDEAALEQSARLLEQKLSGFGVQGQVVEIQPGPVVTMYKVEPGEGVKVSQIVNLADDLSMALRAASVRILAPVPGEAVVGIEVPNRKRERVYLREILEAEEFNASASQLAIALGKDIAGCPVSADLASMPHLLIAGATGTGKSVSIHTMVASILFKATADGVRFILIDPKMLELSVYEGIPHLLVPVVVVALLGALAWLGRLAGSRAAGTCTRRPPPPQRATPCCARRRSRSRRASASAISATTTCASR